MAKLIEVREFQEITNNKDYDGKNGYKYLDSYFFDQLVSFVEEYNGDNDYADAMDFLRVYKSKDRNVGLVVSIKNYVGLIQFKNGDQIQILPKIDFVEQIDDANFINTKKIFIKMIKSFKDFSGKISSSANLDISRMNVYEIFINMYLNRVRNLVLRGIRSAYTNKEEQQKFYKGKLNVSQHIKHNICHKERFYVEYDEFLVNRPENRLIKATLNKLKNITTTNENSKEIRQLLTHFELVKFSENYDKDFSMVNIDRIMKDYEMLLKWSRVFLYNKSFTTFSGTTMSHSLLFSMERIFESYVAQQLKKIFTLEGWEIFTQDNRFYLFEEPKNNKRLFCLRPDIVIKKENTTVILDTKWKRLIPNEKKNYGISSADMYQMYAYSKRYTKLIGDEMISPEVWLLYPKTEEMSKSLFFVSNDGVKVHAFFIDIANIVEKDGQNTLFNLLEQINQNIAT